ncbi:MAG TPA: FecR domain-containing protein [Candidatus Moranbacteria bacterium]|nr:FecR domain-containing protein [Candidatus Moranbacteria bacterium]
MKLNKHSVTNKKILQLFFVSFLLLTLLVCLHNTAKAAPRQMLKGEATGKVLLNGEPWGTGKVTFTNVSGDASFIVTCEKDISAGANSASCTGTNVNGFFSGGPNGYATFGSGSELITLQLTDGKKFTYAQSGVTAELEVDDSSIFDNWDSVDEEENTYEPEEYDPNAPLTDSGVRVAEIDGQAEIACPPDFDAWNVLKHNTVIYNHCRLKTGENSTLKISFSSMATFVMRPETEIGVNEATKEKSNFQLFFGGVWTNVKKMAKGEEFGFKGSQAVAGIKGTTFIMEDTGEITTLKVIEGLVNYKPNTNGEGVDVEGGKMISATKEGLGTQQAFNVETENIFWDNLSDSNNAPETKAERKDKSKYLYIGGASILVVIIVALGLFISKKKKS